MYKYFISIPKPGRVSGTHDTDGVRIVTPLYAGCILGVCKRTHVYVYVLWLYCKDKHGHWHTLTIYAYKQQIQKYIFFRLFLTWESVLKIHVFPLCPNSLDFYLCLCSIKERAEEK